MPTPKPFTSLDNSCMVIHDNTLYIQTPGAFSSIPLTSGAKWTKLQTGVDVVGSTCLGSTPSKTEQAGFYLVGGKGDADYSGLQKYTYSTGKWTTIKLVDQVTQNRQGHAAVYTEADDAIVMYAGNQGDGATASSQTFTIQGSEPYPVRGYPASGPPSESPLMFPWNGTHAAMVTGGGRLWLFNTATTWIDTMMDLPHGLDDRESKRLTLYTAKDGTKAFYVFDIKESPMSVSLIVVQNAKGELVKDPSTVKRSTGEATEQTKRIFARDNWPEYNSNFAPESMGPNVGMASGPDGLIAFASKDSLQFFNAKENSWMNATDMLGKKQQQVLQFSADPTTTSASTKATSTSATSTTPGTANATSSDTTTAVAGASGRSSGLSSNAILGITLGCVLGLMALLGLLLLLLRRRKRRRQLQKRVAAAEDEKDATAFAQSPIPAAPTGSYFLRGHHPKASRESWSSMAILMGRVGKDRPGLSRRLSNGTSRSSVSSLHKMFKSTISKPIPQSATQPVLTGHDEKNVAFAPDVGTPRPRPRVAPAEARDTTRRSSGWNRYWSGGSALQMLGLGPAKRNTSLSEQSSRYSDGGNAVKVRQDSATVPALNLDGRPEVSNVVSGSPMVAQYVNGVPTEGMSGKIVRSGSHGSSGYSSGIPESINEAWDSGGWGAKQASTADAHGPSHHPGTSSAQGATTGRAPPPTGVSQQPQLAMSATSSDMSWLNLGDQSRR